MAMTKDLGEPLAELRVDGGAAKNDLLMQLQADVLNSRCVRPTQLETTALGSAFLAGLAVGVWDSPTAVSDAWATDCIFSPEMPAATRDTLLANWKSAVQRA